MGDTGVRRTIISQLSSLYPGVYSKDNVAFVATHSHAGVGGYVENLLPQITSLGYVKETADAIVAGTVRAVQRAHGSLAPGRLRLGNATVLDANVNRSPTAYLANPAEERAKYQYDVDKDMTVLRFDDESGKARGLLSFFPVHGTSLYIVSVLFSFISSICSSFFHLAVCETLSLSWFSTLTFRFFCCCTFLSKRASDGRWMTLFFPFVGLIYQSVKPSFLFPDIFVSLLLLFPFRGKR